jgi:DNA modification methylase
MTTVSECRVVCADYNDIELSTHGISTVDCFIIDPPYGKVVNEAYDKVSLYQAINNYYKVLDWASKYAHKGTSCYLFGGIGRYKYRPFFSVLSMVEDRTKWKIQTLITWKKRRGIGAKYNYMFAREEICFLIYDNDTPKYFKPLYLEEERSDEWKKRLKSSKYQPKTNKLRRSNVFADINEIFRNQYKGVTKNCIAEKPSKLIDVLVEASCPTGGIVVDPMAGSGTTGIVCQSRGMDCFLIEKDPKMVEVIRSRLIEAVFSNVE